MIIKIQKKLELHKHKKQKLKSKIKTLSILNNLTKININIFFHNLKNNFIITYKVNLKNNNCQNQEKL